MTMLIWCFCGTIAQSTNDSLRSIQNQLQDSSQKKYDKIINRVFSQNKFVNLSSSSGNFINKEKGIKNKDVLFYILTTTLLMLGIFKMFYSRYFYNIFRVFFNTSLRQNQLTDMLLQAKLPSLIFNIFFMISGGIYIWSLLNYYHLFKSGDNIVILTICILALGLVYLRKFFSLIFIG